MRKQTAYTNSSNNSQQSQKMRGAVISQKKNLIQKKNAKSSQALQKIDQEGDSMMPPCNNFNDSAKKSAHPP